MRSAQGKGFCRSLHEGMFESGANRAFDPRHQISLRGSCAPCRARRASDEGSAVRTHCHSAAEARRSARRPYGARQFKPKALIAPERQTTQKVVRTNTELCSPK